MELKKPNSKAIGDGAALIGGTALGAMVSRGVIGAVYTPVVSTDATVIAKDANKLLMYRAGLMLVAAAGAVAINGSGTATILAKGALAGMAVMQTVEIVKEYAGKNKSLAETTTGTKKFIAKTLGLACGCADNANSYIQPAMNGIARRRSLRGIEIPMYQQQGSNVFEAAIQKGRVA